MTRAELEATVARILPRLVEENASDLVPDDCWVWTGAKTGANPNGGRGGYGVVRVTGRSRTGSPGYVHRIMYEYEYGPLPDGSEPDHVCRVTACARPSHLEAVPHRENIRRAYPRRTLSAA